MNNTEYAKMRFKSIVYLMWDGGLISLFVATASHCDLINSLILSVNLLIECIRSKEPSMAGAASKEKEINHILGDKANMTLGASLRWREEQSWVGQMSYDQPSSRNKPCESPSFALFAHSNCRVSPCCADTMQDFVIGDFRDAEDYRYFVNSPTLSELCYSLVNMDFNPICKRCDFSSVADDALLASRQIAQRGKRCLKCRNFVLRPRRYEKLPRHVMALSWEEMCFL